MVAIREWKTPSSIPKLIPKCDPKGRDRVQSHTFHRQTSSTETTNRNNFSFVPEGPQNENHACLMGILYESHPLHRLHFYILHLSMLFAAYATGADKIMRKVGDALTVISYRRAA